MARLHLMVEIMVRPRVLTVFRQSLYPRARTALNKGSTDIGLANLGGQMLV